MVEILVVIAILTFIVYVHEIGHHAAAKRLGIEVAELSLGFGKKLFQWISPKSGTAYTLRLLPFGGYNCFLSVADFEGRHAAPASFFDTAPVWKRLVTIAAGPTANLLLALILSTGLWVADHISAGFTACADVMDMSAVETMELQGGIFIRAIQAFGELMQNAAASPGSAIEAIGGPIGTIQAMRSVVSEEGMYGVVIMLILSSVSVGLANLLPIPGLDGSQLLTLLIEKIRGRRLSARMENAYGWLCMVSIGILFCVMVYNDVSVIVRSFFG